MCRNSSPYETNINDYRSTWSIYMRTSLYSHFSLKSYAIGTQRHDDDPKWRTNIIEIVSRNIEIACSDVQYSTRLNDYILKTKRMLVPNGWRDFSNKIRQKKIYMTTCHTKSFLRTFIRIELVSVTWILCVWIRVRCF